VLLLLILFTIVGLDTALFTCGLWYLSKSTTYHFFRSAADYLDHCHLPKHKDSIEMTRSLPKNFLCDLLLRPHSDRFHLEHHFYPAVPHYNLEMIELDKSAGYRFTRFFGSKDAVFKWQ
jgi:fatty acid desaturase